MQRDARRGAHHGRAEGRRRRAHDRGAPRRERREAARDRGSDSPPAGSTRTPGRWTSPTRRRPRRSATEFRAWLDAHLTDEFAVTARRLARGRARHAELATLRAWNRDARRRAATRRSRGPRSTAGAARASWSRSSTPRRCTAPSAPGTLNLLGLSNIAPAIIEHGTEEQKQSLLPRMLRGDDIWCQGFSEPDAGSDLASLRTTRGARRRRLGRQRAEDLEHARPPRQLVRAARAHRSGRSEAQGHHVPARRHDAAGRRGAAAHHDHRRAASSTRSSSPTCASRRRRLLGPVERGLARRDDDARVRARRRREAAPRDCVARSQRLLDLARATVLRRRSHRGRRPGAPPAAGARLPRGRAAQAGVATARSRASCTAARSAPRASIAKLVWSETEQHLGEVAADVLGPDANERHAGARDRVDSRGRTPSPAAPPR